MVLSGLTTLLRVIFIAHARYCHSFRFEPDEFQMLDGLKRPFKTLVKEELDKSSEDSAVLQRQVSRLEISQQKELSTVKAELAEVKTLLQMLVGPNAAKQAGSSEVCV